MLKRCNRIETVGALCIMDCIIINLDVFCEYLCLEND